MNRIIKQANWYPEREGMGVADYKRMVSYMYQYENGVKNKNVGFARVEAKDGQCKITLHMQLLGQLDSIFPTYMLQRKHSDLELIYLGDTVLKNQIMDSKLITEENNIMQSGYPLSDMGGILLFLKDNLFFATEWDDMPIEASEVLEALKPKPDREPKLTLQEELSIPKYKLPRGIKTIERLQQQSYYYTKKDPNDEMRAERMELDYSRNPNQESAKVKLVDASGIDTPLKTVSLPEMESLAEEERGLAEEQEVALPEVEAYAGESHDKEGITSVEIIQEVSENIEREGSKKLEQNASEGMKEEASEGIKQVVFEEVKQEASKETEQETSGTIKQEEREKKTREMVEEAADPQVVAGIFEKYPRIYPFEDNEIIICVKIEPKDIGLLPKELWTLSNNSFLIHGYYCYHHLIFAKMKDRFGNRYILGVPGIYHNREMFMAKMFGFESFKPIRRRELRQGDFGYWYTPVNF